MNEIEKNGNNVLFRPAVLVLSGILVFNLLSFCVRIVGENDPYHYEYSEMQRAMSSGDYPELMGMVSRNRVREADTRKDTAEFAAVAKYYEAASLYRALTESGDTDRAAEMKERLTEAEKELKTQAFTEAGRRIKTLFQVDG